MSVYSFLTGKALNSSSLSEEQLQEMIGCTAIRRQKSSFRRIELEALLPGYV